MTENSNEPEVIEYGPTKKRPWLVIILALSLLITWFILGTGYYFYKKNSVNTASQNGKVAIADIKQELKAQQEEIYKQIGSVQKTIEEIPKETKQETPVIQNNNDDIKQSLSELSDKLRSIEKKVENPESKIDNTLTPLMLSAINLRQRINEGSSYQLELQILKDMSRKDSALAAKVDEISTILEKNEIRRLQDLQAEFPSIADSAALSFSKNSEGKELTVFDKFKNMVGNWVVIRKVEGDLTGNHPEIIIARMGRSVKSGNLRRALEEYKKLEVEKAVVPTLETWSIDAERLLEIEGKLAELNSYIVRRSGTLPSPFSTSPSSEENGILDEGNQRGDDQEEDSVSEEKPTDAI
jgi:hypothetical protein